MELLSKQTKLNECFVAGEERITVADPHVSHIEKPFAGQGNSSCFGEGQPNAGTRVVIDDGRGRKPVV
jgi:hypothetical protein